MLTVAGNTATVSGSGHAWLVTSDADGARVRAVGHGDAFTVPA
jgi:hypothetical protein